jgi:hypothetical protein
VPPIHPSRSNSGYVTSEDTAHEDNTSVPPHIITDDLDLLEPLCYQPPHLDLPSSCNQPRTTIIEAFRAVFLPPVIYGDPSIFARAKYPRAHDPNDNDLTLEKPITITRSQIKAAGIDSHCCRRTPFWSDGLRWWGYGWVEY